MQRRLSDLDRWKEALRLSQMIQVRNVEHIGLNQSSRRKTHDATMRYVINALFQRR